MEETIHGNTVLVHIKFIYSEKKLERNLQLFLPIVINVKYNLVDFFKFSGILRIYEPYDSIPAKPMQQKFHYSKIISTNHEADFSMVKYFFLE